MNADMLLPGADSAPGAVPGWHGWERVGERDDAEEARRLEDPRLEVRVAAAWHHWTVNEESYVRWVHRKGYRDATYLAHDDADIVRNGLLAFVCAVARGYYHSARGSPAGYIRSIITHQVIDSLRKGLKTTRATCQECVDAPAPCPIARSRGADEEECGECFKPLLFEDFEVAVATFTAAQLREQEVSVAEDAMFRAIYGQVEEIAREVLLPREWQVLRMTFLEENSGEEIAEAMGLTAANVYQIRRRALVKLREAVAARGLDAGVLPR
jgi:RNA polymerase sigma factor (sigma-70 family)